MKRIFVAVVLAGLLLGVVGQASAFEVCFGYAGLGNKLRLEFTPLGSFFALNGRDRVFAERAITGTAYVEPSTGQVRMGFTEVGNDGGTVHVDTIQNVMLSLATFSGPVAIAQPAVGVEFTDTIFVIGCTGTLAAETERPDSGSRR